MIFLKKILLVIILIPLFFITKDANAYQNEKSYCVLEENSLRILEGNNYNKISLIASTTKIMTCLIACETNNLNRYVTPTYEDVNIDGSKIYLDINDKVVLLDLLYGLMLRSGNDCANIIAKTCFNDYDLFIKKMNDKCKEIGMTNTTFSNPSGLDYETINYSTAYDMSLLMIYAMKNPIFSQISSTKSYSFKSYNNKYYYLTNKHKLVLNDDAFIAGKTGYTKKSGRILVSYGKINNMKGSITTINDSVDWSNHKKYLNNAKKYTESYTIKKGTYSSFNYDLYNVIVRDDIVIPIKSEEKKDLSLKILFNRYGVYLYAYCNEKLILKKRLEYIKK